MTTQYANATYQEIIDLHTVADRVSVVAVHTPCSTTPVNMLHGFWDQFRQFKYNGCSLSLVPSATLPADISQVGYGAGEAPIDMRDILNPIMFHGCHGEDLGSILNGFLGMPADYAGDSWSMHSSDSAEIRERQGTDNVSVAGNALESLYYRALTDRTWQKAHPQRGFRKSGLHPMVYNVVSNTPFGMVSPGDDTEYYFPKGKATDGDVVVGDTPQATDYYPDGGEMGASGSTSSPLQFKGRTCLGEVDGTTVSIGSSVRNIAFGTNRLVPLGWRDTRSPIMGKEAISNTIAVDAVGTPVEDLALNQLYADRTVNQYHTVDKAYMGLILLPPAYKAQQYMRLILTHSFSFRRFRGASMQTDNVRSVGYAPGYFDFN